MKVAEIRLNRFTRHRETVVRLPERAVVLATGANGRGKSSLLEAVAYAGWKRGLRDTRWGPWTEGVPGSVELVAGNVEIRRKVSKAGSVTTTWNLPGQEPTKWETATKGQEALEQVIGDFDIWVRACTFSKAHAQKAARFGAATDGERKTLLETILGLDYFDLGLKKCRDDLKKLRTQRADVQHRMEIEKVTITNQRQRLADVERDLAAAKVPETAPKPTPQELPPIPAEVPPVANPPITDAEALAHQRIANLEQQIADEEAHDRALAKEIEGLTTAGVKDDAAAEEHGRRHDRLNGGTCPECEQKVPDALLASLTAKAVQARATARAAREEANRRKALLVEQREEAAMNLADFRKRLTALTSERAALVARLAAERQAAQDARNAERKAVQERRRLIEQANATALRTWEDGERARKEAAKKRDDLLARKAEVEKAIGRAEQLVAADEGQHAELTMKIKVKEAAEYALSPKGFRAHILAKTLNGLSACANSWLAMLGYGSMRVELRPYSEKADGDVADAIDLKVHGVGHDYGYRGCSDGEQRRLDIAFLLALMEVSTGALGASDSTLWLDEVFDALDVDGVRAVCSLLDRLAKDRTVVVIAHSPALIEALRPAMVLHVEPDPSEPEVSRVVVTHRPRAAAA